MKNTKKTMLVMAMTAALTMSTIGAALAAVATPSTNDENRVLGWAHFEVVDDTIAGQVTVKFVSTRGFYSCFEYRSENSEPIATPHPYVDADDLWDYVCVNNSTAERTILADAEVEIRMIFGAEGDERFDWTSVPVTPVPPTKEDCMDGGWETLGDYKNQGQCVSSFASNK